jgi:hypothetical protein
MVAEGSMVEEAFTEAAVENSFPHRAIAKITSRAAP